MQIEDLTAFEADPATAAKGIANLLMCFNSELRLLYDIYW